MRTRPSKHASSANLSVNAFLPFKSDFIADWMSCKSHQQSNMNANDLDDLQSPPHCPERQGVPNLSLDSVFKGTLELNFTKIISSKASQLLKKPSSSISRKIISSKASSNVPIHRKPAADSLEVLCYRRLSPTCENSCSLLCNFEKRKGVSIEYLCSSSSATCRSLY